MAGGKETPRQKMIGMMYIVLTALLALNVSKTILDAFVAIEENIQLGNINEYYRGFEKIQEIKKKAAENSVKAKAVMKIVEKIDKETAEIIQLIDEAKLKVLSECEEVVKLGEGEEKDRSILVRDEKRKQLSLSSNAQSVGNNTIPCLPLRFKLAWVDGKDKYDEPMRVIGITEDDQLVSPDPNKYGMKIWNKMISYREDLINNICEVSNLIEKLEKDKDSALKVFSFKDPKITKFSGKENVITQLKSSMKKVSPNDQRVIIDLYLGLLKNEKVKEEEKMLHWVGKTFDHAPNVAVLASLSSLQKDVLAARALALSDLQEKVGGGDYSFNKVVAIARPENMIVPGGSEFLVSVSMGAFDSEKQPLVVPTGGGVLFGPPKNGIQLIKYKAPASGSIKITGSVSIEKKSGGMEERFYGSGTDGEKPLEVMVAPKTGALELPECAILYLNYDNIIVPAAPGVTDLSLTGGRPTTYEGKKAFIVRPTAPGKKVLSLSGKGADQKTVNIGSWTYKVKEMPPPILMTTTITKAGGRVSVAMAGGVLAVTYTILSGICEEVQFTGDRVPAAAVAGLRSGKTVKVILQVKNNKTGLKENPVKGVLKVQ